MGGGPTGGTARPEGFARGFAQGSRGPGAAARIPRKRGAARLVANRRRTTHTLTHTHAPLPPVSNFEPHSHTAFGVFWTPQGRGTGDGAMVSKGEDQLAG